MNSWSRKLFAANNPAACALFFDFMMKKFISVILRYKRDERGVYGRCKAYFGTVEAQGKGTLHCHMLIWLDGHLSPQTLRDRMSESEEFKDKVFKWLESIIKCEFPSDSSVEQAARCHKDRVRHKEVGNPHPGTIPLPRLEGCDDERLFWAQYTDMVEQLVNEYNWHIHTSTCWKNLKRGEPKNDLTCQMRMNGEVREKTTLDETTKAILLRRHHAHISAYTDLVTFLLQCNVNVQFIGSGDAAKAFMYYVTDYITKPNIPVHVGMAALAHVARKTQADHEIGAAQALGAVTSAVNGMMGRTEISHPQVMSYLIGGGDHYTSESFGLVNWGGIRRMVEAEAKEDDADTCRMTEVANPSASVIIDGNEISASNQYLDYAYRYQNAPIGQMCMYDFFGNTIKRKVSNEQRSGRFQEGHPQTETHCMSIRQRNVIPVLLGPSIPNPSTSDETRERWAFDMLVLFKPWRKPSELKEPAMSWSDAFENYRPSMSKRHSQLVANMTVLTECRDAKEYHATRRRRGDDKMANDPPEMTPYSDIPEGFLADAFSGIQTFSEGEESGRREDNVRESVLDSLGEENTRLLNLCLPSPDVGFVEAEDTGTCTEVNETDRKTIGRISADMTLKRKRQIVGLRDEEEREERIATRRRIDDPSVQIMTLEAGSSAQSYSGYGMAVAAHVAREMSLNRQQKRAFTMIIRQLLMPKGQLLMHVSGVGGTGKSHVIRCIVRVFERLNRRRELLLGAPTGIAAVLIGGQTLHSLIMLGISSSKGKVSHEDLIHIWESVRFLIVDEVSMLGAAFLSKLSDRMRIGKGNHPVDSQKPFGGVNVIFMGDFGQLSPPKQISLYSYTILANPSLREGTKRGVEAMNGTALWRQVTKVVELKRNERQSGDPVYAAFLGRLRVRKCFKKPEQGQMNDYQYICQRLLSNIERSGQGASLPAFQDAPIIVGSKVLRDMLNARLTVHHANRQNQTIHDYYSKDIFSGAKPSPELQKLLWAMPSTLNGDSFGRLSLFIGMRVMITENIAFGWGVVNRCEGTVVEIKYEVVDGRRYALAAFVLIEGCGISITGLPEDVVPILLSGWSVKCDHIQFPGLTAKSFNRRQLPLIPAYAFTDYKSQGRTMERVIVDIASAFDLQGVYVMLSRVKSLAGLVVLRMFPASKITAQLSHPLRTELERLAELDRRTEEEEDNIDSVDGLDTYYDLIAVSEGDIAFKE